MAVYELHTLVDVTRTQPTRAETNQQKLAQQANFNTLIQVLELRSNISWNIDPKEETGTLKYTSGKATHWIWQFESERDDVYLDGTDPVGLLVKDLNNVPIINGLNNSVDIHPAVFKSIGKDANIWITEIARSE